MNLTEKRVPFELIPIDTMKELQHKAPEFLGKQPFGQVPAIVSGSLFLTATCSEPHVRKRTTMALYCMYESRAICRYILEQYPTNGPQLIPTGVKSKALFEQAASVEFANFDPIVKKILLATFGYPWVSQNHNRLNI
jgi:glutathione S-transferase